MKTTMNYFAIAAISALTVTSLATAEPVLNTALIQQTLRGTPISTAPRVGPGDGPAPEPRYWEGRSAEAGPPAQRRESGKSDEEIFWPDESNVPVLLRTVFACLWIFVIGSLPFIIPMIDRKPVTTTQKFVGATMLIVLFGGLYLFTNIILFQSVHFKRVRPLTIIECIYFMSQVITTVGYGDIYPAKVRGQVFVGLYVLGAIFIIAMLVSDVTNYVTLAADRYRQKLKQQLGEGSLAGRALAGAGDLNPHSPRMDRSATVNALITPKKPSLSPLATSCGVFAAICTCWVVFFSNYPGEEKNAFQAIYMAVITLSTVGLGAFTPLTEGGMIFGAFFMLFGVAGLTNAIGNFCTYVAQMHEYERFSHNSKKEATRSLKEIIGGSQQVTKMQFFQWAVVNQNLMTNQQVEQVFAAFKDLDPVNSIVDIQKVEQSMGVSARAPALSIR